MNSKNLAFVALRVLAIYYLIAAITTALSSFSAGLTLDLSDESKNYATSFFYFSLIPFFLYMGAAIVLWFFSSQLSQYVSNDGSNSESKGGVKIEDIQVITFAAIGLYLVFSALPYISGALYKMYAIKKFDDNFVIPIDARLDVIGLSLSVVLGLILFFGARGFSGLLTWVRALGLKSK